MTDAYVQLAADGPGKKVDTSELAVGLNTVERQRIVVADPATAAALAAVKNTSAAESDYGMVVRIAGRPQHMATIDENPAPLSASATFDGTAHDMGDLSSGGQGYARWRVYVYADQPGTVNMQQSKDGSTWRTTQSQPVAALSPLIVESMVARRYLRAEFVNGTNASTVFELEIMLVSI